MRIRVIMPVIIDQAGRPFNVDEADGTSRRHRRRLALPNGETQLELETYEWLGKQLLRASP